MALARTAVGTTLRRIPDSPPGSPMFFRRRNLSMDSDSSSLPWKWRPFLVPVGAFLVGVRNGDEPSLAPSAAGELDAGRKIVEAEAVGDRQGRLSHGIAGGNDRSAAARAWVSPGEIAIDGQGYRPARGGHDGIEGRI